jgi:site-specific DNA-methyltransferase (adenine-specific)
MTVTSIQQGDCLRVMATLPDGCVDLTVTSPPYDNLRDYNGFVFDFEGIAQQLYRITKQGGVVVWVVGDATVNGSETGTSFKQALYFKEIGFNLHDTMIYEKANISFPDSVRYYNAFEYMFVFSKGNVRVFNPIKIKNKLAGKPVTSTKRGKDGIVKPDSGLINKKVRPEKSIIRNIWKYANGCQGINQKHPAVFPEKLANDHILSWSNEGDLVLDPMCGSGTTLKMAQINKRNSFGIDISQDYVDLAKLRCKEDI